MDDKKQESGSMSGGSRRMRWGIALGLTTFLVLAVLLYRYGPAFFGQGGRSESIFAVSAKKGEIVPRMRTNLLKSVEYEKSAVMAVTDEESKTFADLSRKSAGSVDRDFQELKALVALEGTDREKKLLGDFGACWRNFGKIDEALLPLSVENTNLKAASLSQTKGLAAVRRFSGALAKATEALQPDREGAPAARLAYRALNAVFTIYSLQGPHINEAEDRKMDEMEVVMRANAAEAKRSLAALAALAGREGKTYLEEADAAFADFMAVHAEVVRLSRLNSNVKSLELSLGEKRKVTAQCDDILNAMQEAVWNRASRATR
jgi:hypothetical protein